MSEGSPRLAAEIPRRAPFRIDRLPPLARVQLWAERDARGVRRILAKLARALFRTVHDRLGVPAEGILALDRGGGAVAQLRIDLRHTLYGAIARDAAGGGYEPETSALIDRIVPDGGVFFDVGANWGPFTLLVAARPGFAGRVVAFEPLVAVRAELASLVAQAGLTDRVAVRGEALSDLFGQGRMTSGWHSALARLGAGEGGERVAVARLDDLDLPPPDVIKIDIEGHEARALEGARATIEKSRPLIVLESWYRPSDPQASLAPLRWLEAAGFALYRPMWRIGAGDSAALSPHPDRVAASGTLVLLPFAAADRLAFGADFNALACPREKLDALRQLFAPEP
jgi:FkbM family methyltransferase